MTPAERRAALLEWLYADEERSGMNTGQIVAQATQLPQSGGLLAEAWLYTFGPEEDVYSRAYRDLCALARDGQITRGQHGGKATWWYT